MQWPYRATEQSWWAVQPAPRVQRPSSGPEPMECRALGDLPGIDQLSQADAVSADGSTIVGFSKAIADGVAFRWTEFTDLQSLGFLPGGGGRSFASDVTASGSTVVGYSMGPSITEPFVWTASGGMQRLGTLPGGRGRGEAQGISSDGRVIVGNADSGGASLELFVWIASEGMFSLTDWLEADGVDLGEWTLVSVSDISADGRTIVGTGRHSDGFSEAWIVTIPEPSAPVLLILALSLLVGHRHSKEVTTA